MACVERDIWALRRPCTFVLTTYAIADSMIIRQQFSRWSRNLHTEIYLPPSSMSLIPITHRDAHTNHSISMAHPMDPSNSNPSLQPKNEPNSAPSTSSPPPPSAITTSAPELEPTNVPSTIRHHRDHYTPPYTHPPFHTHAFFSALEKTFPTPTARSLMRATRALLVDRIGRVRREGLTYKDLDNVGWNDAYVSNPQTKSDLASISIPRCPVRASFGDDSQDQE